MAPSVVAFVLFAIFHVSHGVENGNQDAPSPPSDKMKALSNLAPTLHRGPADHSAIAITVYCKTAMVELQAYAATVVQGDSVMKKDVRLCGEIAKGLVGRIEKTLGTDFKLFKISPAQKRTLDRAWAKIEDTTPNHVQSLDKWCQGAKNVMDDLALEGYAQATGCILVIKDLIRKIQELSTAHQDPPQKSEGTPVVVSRKLQENPPIEIPTPLPSQVSGNTADGSAYPSLESQCTFENENENVVLYSLETSSSAVILDVEDVIETSFHAAVVIDQAGDCIYWCPSFLPCTFLTPTGQTYRIIVFAYGPPGGFQLRIRSEDIADPEPIQLEELPATVNGNTDLPSNGGSGGLYSEFFGTVCGLVLGVDFLGVLHTFEASDPITRFETCGSEFDTNVLVFNQDGSCLSIVDSSGLSESGIGCGDSIFQEDFTEPQGFQRRVPLPGVKRSLRSSTAWVEKERRRRSKSAWSTILLEIRPYQRRLVRLVWLPQACWALLELGWWLCWLSWRWCWSAASQLNLIGFQCRR